MRYETIQALKDEEFKRSSGVQRGTFEKMLEVVETGLCDFGRPAKLSRADQLLMTLMYWREYQTEFHTAQSYGVSEATVCRTIIQKVENALVRSGKLRLPGKKALQYSDTVFEVLLVDVSEQPVERPKKPKTALQRHKEAPYPEAQVIADRKSAAIVATAFSYGSKHDFQLFREDGSDFAQHLCFLADAGYQGLAELHENCQTPFKKSKYPALTQREKQRNRALAECVNDLRHSARA